MFGSRASLQGGGSLTGSNGFETFLLLGLAALAVIIVVLVVIAVTVSLNNEAWTGEGTVVGRDFTPAHTTVSTTFITSGKVLVPMVTPVSYADKWTLTLRDDNGRDHQVPVSKRDYRKVKDGERFTQK